MNNKDRTLTNIDINAEIAFAMNFIAAFPKIAF